MPTETKASHVESKRDFKELKKFVRDFISSKKYLGNSESIKELLNQIQQNFTEEDRKIIENFVEGLLKACEKDAAKDGSLIKIAQTEYIDDPEYNNSFKKEILKYSYTKNPEKYFEIFESLSSCAKEDLINLTLKQLDFSTPSEDLNERNKEIKKFKKIESLILKYIDYFEEYSDRFLRKVNLFYKEYNLNIDSFKNSAYKQENGSRLIHLFSITFEKDSPEQIEKSRKNLAKKLLKNKENLTIEDKQKLYQEFLKEDPKLILKIIKSSNEIFDFKNRDEILNDLYQTFLSKEPIVILQEFKIFSLVTSLYEVIYALAKKGQTIEILQYINKFPKDVKDFAFGQLSSFKAKDFENIEVTPSTQKTVLDRYKKQEKLDEKYYFVLSYFRFLPESVVLEVVELLFTNNEEWKLIDLLIANPNLPKDVQERILELSLNSRLAPRLDPIISRFSVEYQNRYQQVQGRLVVNKQNSINAGREVMEKGEDADDEMQRTYQEVLVGLQELIQVEERMQRLIQRGADPRVINHLQRRYEKTLTDSRFNLKKLEKLGEELGGLTVIETIAFLQKRLTELIASCEIFHGTGIIGLRRLLNDESGRFKHAIELEGTKYRGEINAGVEQKHFGEIYSENNEERPPYLIFGFLSQEPTGREESTEAYGPIRIKINRNRVEDRSTIYQGDTSGDSFHERTPQALTNPHVSFIIDHMRYGDTVPSLEELCLNENFISQSYVTTQGFGFVEVQIHNNLYIEDIEEIFIETSVARRWLKTEQGFEDFKREIIEKVNEINRKKGINIKVSFV